jgi:ATP-dependent Zn protease
MTQLREHTAYHEAGHAVVAFRLGYEIKKVTIKRSRGSLGRYVCSTPRRNSPDEIKIDLAGPLAEALVNPSNELIELGSRGDWRSIRRSTREFEALRFIGDDEGDILIEELLHDTRALVRRDAEAIARVAAALLKHETLTGDDIKRLMEGRS